MRNTIAENFIICDLVGSNPNTSVREIEVGISKNQGTKVWDTINTSVPHIKEK